MSILNKLCKTYTNLTPKDIDILERYVDILPVIADLVKADVFIDCLTMDPNKAIVVAESKPKMHPSIYKGSVISQLALRDNEPAVLRTLETGIITRDLKAITQENVMVNQNVVPIKNSLGEAIAVLIMEQDATEDLNHNKHVEILAETTQQLTESLLNYKKSNGEYNVTQHINDAIIIFDNTGIAIFANPASYELYRNLGYKDDISGMSFNNLVLDDSSFKDIMKSNQPKIAEINIGEFILQVKYIVSNDKEYTNIMIMLIKDITDVKEKEKELILKSVAMQEIHHRVKNNLQTIASILRLQLRRIDDDQVKFMLQEITNRILSIAVTHETLAQNGIDDVDIKLIIEKLVEEVKYIGLSINKDIKIKIEGDSVMMDSDKATFTSLVINELLQNCIQHAFVNKNKGIIRINVQKGIMYSHISIIDDGVGFNLEDVSSDSLGLSIVNSIIKDKLRGSIRIDSTREGTNIAFDIINK